MASGRLPKENKQTKFHGHAPSLCCAKHVKKEKQHEK